jgi:hypothetical protein
MRPPKYEAMKKLLNSKAHLHLFLMLLLVANLSAQEVIDGEKIPIEITKKGWIFDPQEGERIQGKYIFGEDNVITVNDLEFSLEGDEISPIDGPKFDDSIIILGIIIIGGIGAAIFFLKGYKK